MGVAAAEIKEKAKAVKRAARGKKTKNEAVSKMKQ